MSKTEILFLRKKYIELGLIITRTIHMPDGTIIEKKVNIAEELNFRDASGRPDLDLAQQAIDNEKLATVRHEYDLTKALLKEMKHDELIWEAGTEEMNWDKHRELFFYCECMLLKMRVIPRFDTMHLQIVQFHDGVDMGARTPSEKELEKGEGKDTDEIQNKFNK